MKKAFIKYILAAAALAVTLGSCSGTSDDEQAAHRESEKAVICEILRPEPPRPNYFDERLDSMPPAGKKMKINSLGSTLGKVFNDSNHVHVKAASAVGISPVISTSDAWASRRHMVKIESCPDFYVDNLTHSLPYLVPEAATLLHDIGSAFRDSLASRGGGSYRVKVTSVLRTPETIKSLRRGNINAVATSTHLFGTTFDISYSRFVCDNATLPRTQEDLKNLLAEVLFDLSAQSRCYVKYERKQACFHITVRPPLAE